LYGRSLLGSRYLGSSSLSYGRSLLGSRYLGASSLTLRRSRLYDPFGSRSLLLGRGLSRYGYYR
ncbi:MAG: hypothetical protein ACE5F6_14325, partial [Anaerolineae bacterium]